MCQILLISGVDYPDKITEFLSNDNVLSSVNDYLKIKGERDYCPSLLIQFNNITKVFPCAYNAWEKNEFEEFLENFDTTRRRKYHLLFFNRMAPETEVTKPTISQPYFNAYNRKYYAVHGLISNAEEIAQSEQFIISVDTEIFQKSPKISQHIQNGDLQGKYVVFEIPEDDTSVKIYSNSGLGPWKIDPKRFFITLSHQRDKFLNISSIYGTSALNETLSSSLITLPEIYIRPLSSDFASDSEIARRKAFALFSGGLDITATCVRFQQEHPDVPIEGIYFDWGSRASQIEIAAGKRAVKKDILDEFKVIDVKEFFNTIFQIGGETLLSADDASGGGVNEAETTRAYVPYRNTFFMALLGTYIEKNYGDSAYILIGANLSEGMVYNDNSDGYLEVVEQTINLGGKDNLFHKIYAPFKYKTKTEMLASFSKDDIELIFEVSESCYYPVNGKPCGKCGSCLLRQKAHERAIEMVSSKED